MHRNQCVIAFALAVFALAVHVAVCENNTNPLSLATDSLVNVATLATVTESSISNSTSTTTTSNGTTTTGKPSKSGAGSARVCATLVQTSLVVLVAKRLII
ncbi:Hypothetical protein CINCED_3A010471 [Cinara cedri]|uniref:Uncharacterized protein n=1 Tax=Cinara cedri TaxID=506608 RepID=A0A5E4MD45_9HEMI|nr:Hypothetical protein CINCED_3A010471 [Cinara cedri]